MTAIAITPGQAPSPRFDLASVVPGQTVAVARVSDLGGSLNEFVANMLAIQDRGAYVRIDEGSIDTTTPAGELMVDVLRVVAEESASR